MLDTSLLPASVLCCWLQDGKNLRQKYVSQIFDFKRQLPAQDFSSFTDAAVVPAVGASSAPDFTDLDEDEDGGAAHLGRALGGEIPGGLRHPYWRRRCPKG